MNKEEFKGKKDMSKIKDDNALESENLKKIQNKGNNFRINL